ncbi:GNAT family N-acetyltransferase [Enterovirga rhinocerotis]
MLGRSGALEVRLAAGAREVRRAQRTRYKVFFEEMDALPSPLARLSRRDSDLFDEVCDHLLVFDHDVVAKPFRKPKPRVVGTYRLLRRDVAEVGPGFYSAGEFDLGPLLAARPDARILELGRSCVLKPYRSRQTLALLWQGIWAYVRHHGCDVMVGCASLPGTDPQALALPLSYLHHFAAAPPEWRVAPHRALHQPMDLLPREAIDPKAAFKRLPPLLKGYLRLGASIGSGAVIDRAFGTTDVFVVTPIGEIGSRYLDHFSPAANRVAA